jgi:hypothetical protein
LLALRRARIAEMRRPYALLTDQACQMLARQIGERMHVSCGSDD